MAPRSLGLWLGLLKLFTEHRIASCLPPHLSAPVVGSFGRAIELGGKGGESQLQAWTGALMEVCGLHTWRQMCSIGL